MSDSEPEVADPAAEAGVRPLKEIVEAILFASQKPTSTKEIIGILKGAGDSPDPSAATYAKTKEQALREALSELALDCEGRTYEVRESAAGWQLVTRPDYAPWLRQLFPENRSARLSAPALETLAIIAYRQPITRADIEAVRGVAVDGVMQTLLDRALVKISGRAEVPGRPLLYETTQFFMEHFGIKHLDELPNADELRRVELPKAEVPEVPSDAGTPELPLEPSSEPNADASAEPNADASAEPNAEPAISAEAEDSSSGGESSDDPEITGSVPS